MTGFYPLVVGFVGLAVGLFMEGIWYATFSRTQPHIQRRTAYLVQFIRVVAIVLGLRFVLWAPHFDKGHNEEYWLISSILFLAFFVAGCFPMSPCFHVDGATWRDKVPNYSRYIHCLPYDVRWYLRRTTINNALILAILALSSWLPEYKLFYDQVPTIIILFPTVFFWIILTVIRKKFDLFDPPPMESEVVRHTSPKSAQPKPGQPNPFDVEEYLNSLPPKRD